MVISLNNCIRATPSVEQNREQKLKIDVFGEKISSSSGAKSGAKLWLMNSDQLNVGKYS